MGTYIIRRILYFIPTLFIISVLSFLIIQAPPGDYLTTRIHKMKKQYGSSADAKIERLRDRFGLDKPIHVQYYNWMKGIILRGDFGQSFVSNRSVSSILKERIPWTILLSLCGLLFTNAVAIPIGLYSAVKQYSIFDYVFTFLAFLGRSVPNFFLALVLMVALFKLFGVSVGGLFSEQYQGAPWSIGKVLDLAIHLIVPTVVIGTAGTAGTVRVLRGMMLDELNKEYIETARAKGLPEWIVILKHAFKVAARPMIATVGWLLPNLIGGAMIVSIVLSLPTTGSAMLNAIMNQDMYLVGSFVMITSVLTVIGTLISDILLAWIDPRIRFE